MMFCDIAVVGQGEISEMGGQTTISITEEHIRERAHEIYLERGGDGGRALDDWLQAEIAPQKSHGGKAPRRKKK
jgi:hypothetical protein